MTTIDSWAWIERSPGAISWTAWLWRSGLRLSGAKPGAHSTTGYSDGYPPTGTGMRGSQPGSFETAHALPDGTFWKSAAEATHTGETYDDLIVVGGGISGLAAAHFVREHAGRFARILILENHDDFGGHARRNEFQLTASCS